MLMCVSPAWSSLLFRDDSARRPVIAVRRAEGHQETVTVLQCVRVVWCTVAVVAADVVVRGNTKTHRFRPLPLSFDRRHNMSSFYHQLRVVCDEH